MFPENQVWTIPGFLDPVACRDLITFSEHIGYNEAEVSFSQGAKMMKGLRNNYRLLYEDTALSGQLWERLKDHCPPTLDGAAAIGLNEQFRFYRYESEQRFKRHVDGRFRRNDFEESRITFMIYLNDDFEGGETAFDDVTIRPETGMALCFFHELRHEGCPVVDGVKYVLRSDVMYRSKAEAL